MYMRPIIVILLFVIACIPDFGSRQHADEDDLLSYEELHVFYYLAFEKHLYINPDELSKLEKETRAALAEGIIPPEKITQVRKWHHKLKSYLSYLNIAQPTDINGVIKTEISALFLDQLRRESSVNIDLNYPNEDFFQSVQRGEIDLKVNTSMKQKFFRTLIADILAATEKSIIRYHHMFPFVEMGTVCQEINCKQSLVSPPQVFTNIRTVTDLVNATITRLNKAITDLHGIDSTDSVSKRQKYEFILYESAQQGILPIFFTEFFKKKSGKIYLRSQGTFREIKNNLLTAVTPHTVAQAMLEIKNEFVSYRTELKKLNTKQRLSPTDKTLYNWIISNEITVSRLILQHPEYAIIVSFFLHKYEPDKKAMKFIVGALTAAGISTLAIFAANLLVPSLPFGSILGKAIIISTGANFGWLGISALKNFNDHNRCLMMERAILTGTSHRVSDSLEFLRKFEASRKSLILSGTIGLSLSSTAFNQILKSINNGTRPFLQDYINDLHADKDSG